jgi:CubicO group peptidase (beta-lactamase class C family)
MFDTSFLPPDSVRGRVAPTITQGLVHDENAQVLGGVAGHAGLFSTADDLAVFAQMMLNGGEYEGHRIISASTVALFTQRAEGSRALGWEMAEGRHGAGEYLSPSAYGHVGFTGTSMWIDPQRDMFVILLTNRVHAARVKRPSTVIADVRADLADAAALAVLDDDLHITTMPASFRADRAVNWNKPLRTRRSRHKKTRSRPTVTQTRTTVKKSTAKPKKATAKSATAKKPTAKKAPAKKPAAAATKPKAKSAGASSGR